VHVSTHVKQTRARNTVQTKLPLAPPRDFGFSHRSSIQNKNAILPSTRSIEILAALLESQLMH